jgi:hypothetical protein
MSGGFHAVQRKALSTLIAVLMLANIPAAAAYQPIYPEFTSIRESKAYKKFSVRPYSNLSKIHYLIDRFGEAQIEIVYDNQTYAAAFATTVARWFLARNYKKQTPEEWVNQWCSRSIVSNKLIHIKLPDGKFLLAKDVLLQELQELDQVVRENQISHAADKAADVPLDKSNTPLAQTLASAPKSKIS